MADPTLAKVAADVAQALGLKRANDVVGEWFCTDLDGYHALRRDGSNLTDPYFRCACEDWLYARGYRISMGPGQYQEAYDDMLQGGEDIIPGNTKCAPVEAPARLVSAVWRRMQQQEEMK